MGKYIERGKNDDDDDDDDDVIICFKSIARFIQEKHVLNPKICFFPAEFWSGEKSV